MVNILGTNGQDFLDFEGEILHVSSFFTNPYSGEQVAVDDVFNFNVGRYDGLGGRDFMFLSDAGDALVLVDNGEVTIRNIEVFIAGAGGDLVILADEIEPYVDVTINGGGANDILWSNIGDDVLAGFDGDDHLVAGPGGDLILGGSGSDYLNGGVGADRLEGEAGNDTLKFSVDGYDGDGFAVSHDIYMGGEGEDVLVMGDEGERISLERSDLPMYKQTHTSRLDGVERIEAAAGNDDIDLRHDSIVYGNVTILGGQGDDVIRSGAGNDYLYGGDNDPAILLDKDFVDDIEFPRLIEGVDIVDLVPPGTPALGIANDNLTFEFDSTMDLTFRDGYAGYNNTLGLYKIADDGSISDVQILWNNVKDAGVDVTHQVDITAGQYGMFIVGNGDRKNFGYGGKDTERTDNVRFVYDLDGANERDATIHDSAGDVSFVYDDGSSVSELRGDIYHTTERGGAAQLNDDGKVHVVSGLIEGDQDTFMIGFEDLYNTGDADYEDVVIELDIHEKLILDGDVGADHLDGGAGDDVIYGEGGNDVLIGGLGADVLYGGQGADVFVLNVLESVHDRIMDFDLSQGDILSVDGLLAGYNAVDDAISDFLDFSVNAEGDGVLNVSQTAGGPGVTVAVVTGDFDVGMNIDDLFLAGGIEIV